MFLKVKRLQAFENLILETDIIQIGSVADDLLNRSKSDKGTDDSGSSQKASGNNNEDMNRLLDMLFGIGEDDLNSKLNDPAFQKIFTDPGMKTLLDEYFNYLNERITEFRNQLSDELSKPEINEAEVNRITDKLTKFVCRVRVIELVYENLASTGASDFGDEINRKVKDINDSLYETFSLRIVKPAEKTKQAYSKFQGAQTQEEKEEAAAEVFSTLQTAEILAEGLPEAEEGIKTASTEYTARMGSEVGATTIEDIKAGIYVNKNVASLIRRIFEFQYTNWTNESDILNEANKLRTSINGFPDVSQEAKDYLTKLVDQIQVQLMERAKSKEFDTTRYKGIHYDFNKKLPLYERTTLPVTGKQIADDTRLMKFRRAATSLMGLVFGQSRTTGETAEAFQRTGKWAHTLYAKALNSSAKLIGKAVKGREGEMKADAFSRLFIFDTSVVDEPKPKQVAEDAVSPGVSAQVPGAIGGMGPIVPPTATSFGSGDNFGPKLVNKKKKSAVLGFADFIKEQNNR